MNDQGKGDFKDYLNNLYKIFHQKSTNMSFVISHNKNSIITGNQFVVCLPKYDQECEIRQRLTNFYKAPYQNLLAPIFQFDDVILNPLTRGIQLIKFLEKLKNTLQSNQQIYPTIRIQATFTGLSTFKQSSDKSDLTCLELEEKEILIELLLQSNCRVKIICTLDIELAYQVGYTCEQVGERVADMCREFTRFENYRNFSFVIDDRLSPPLDNRYIFDTCLLIESSAFKRGESYSIAKFSSDPFDIKRTIISFDTLYEILEARRNPYIQQSTSEYIYEQLNKRVNQLISKEEQ